MAQPIELRYDAPDVGADIVYAQLSVSPRGIVEIDLPQEGLLRLGPLQWKGLVEYVEGRINDEEVQSHGTS